jgi:hypothetical protein
MTFTLKTEEFYLIVIAFLMLMQLLQWRAIYKLRQQIDEIWTQMVVLIGTFGKEVKDLQEKLNDVSK